MTFMSGSVADHPCPECLDSCPLLRPLQAWPPWFLLLLPGPASLLLILGLPPSEQFCPRGTRLLCPAPAPVEHDLHVGWCYDHPCPECLDARSLLRPLHAWPPCTVLRPRIICLKKVHPAKRARAQELYIVSSYTYAFNETFTCVWIFLWSISLEWQEAHLDDGFTQTIPPASPQIFKWSICSSSLPLIGQWAGPWLGDTGPDWAILKRKQICEKTKFICDSDSIYKLCTYTYE